MEKLARQQLLRGNTRTQLQRRYRRLASNGRKRYSKFRSFLLLCSPMAVAAARSALLKHLRVTVASPAPPRRAAPLFFDQLVLRRRGFSTDEARGTFLDKSEVADRVITVVKNFQKVDPSKVTPNAYFQKDLGLDSLDTVEIVMALEEEFGFEIPDNEADKIDSISLAVDFIASHPQAK
ncbi:acyl carrier protein 2, mitochondrial [Elaeis guineensis]